MVSPVGQRPLPVQSQRETGVTPANQSKGANSASETTLKTAGEHKPGIASRLVSNVLVAPVSFVARLVGKVFSGVWHVVRNYVLYYTPLIGRVIVNADKAKAKAAEEAAQKAAAVKTAETAVSRAQEKVKSRETDVADAKWHLGQLQSEVDASYRLTRLAVAGVNRVWTTPHARAMRNAQSELIGAQKEQEAARAELQKASASLQALKV